MNWRAEVEALRDRLNETAKRSRAAAERDRAPTLAKQAVMVAMVNEFGADEVMVIRWEDAHA